MASTDLDNLITLKSNIIARLNELTAQLLPDVSDQGRSVQLNNLRQSLTDQLLAVDQAIQRASSPYLVRTYGRAV